MSECECECIDTLINLLTVLVPPFPQMNGLGHHPFRHAVDFNICLSII